MEYYTFPDYLTVLETMKVRIPDSSFLEFETYTSCTHTSGSKHMYSINVNREEKRRGCIFTTFNIYKKRERLRFYMNNICMMPANISIYVK